MIHQFLHSHPFVGFTLSGSFLFSGTVMPNMEVHIPDLFMQLSQLSCWGAGVLIAYMTYRKKK